MSIFGRMLLYEILSDSPDEAGSYGEMIVNSTISLPKYKEVECHLFKDVYIEYEGVIHQIDHIFVLKTGVFVVETKMFSRGRLSGKEDDIYWIYSYNGYKVQVYNPIWQNDSHVRYVKNLLGKDIDVQSVIVFAWGNKPKTCKSPKVLNYSEFIDYPLNYKGEKELSREDIDYICHVLSENEKKKPLLKAKHKEQIKNLNRKENA